MLKGYPLLPAEHLSRKIHPNFPFQSLLWSLKWILKFMQDHWRADTVPDISSEGCFRTEKGSLRLSFFGIWQKSKKKSPNLKKKRLFWLCKTDSWPALEYNLYYFKIFCWKFCWNITKEMATQWGCNFPASECNLLHHIRD